MKLLPVALYALAAVLGATGQLLFKLGSEGKAGGFAALATDWRILLGALLYTTILVLFVTGLRLGGELSVLYPVYALTFVFGALLGVLVLKETLTPAKVGGLALILAGVALVAR